MNQIAAGTSATPTPEKCTSNLASVAHSIASAALGLKEGTELPAYFRVGGQYAEDQFKIGWTARQIIAGRVTGEHASFLTHPDAGKDYSQLPEGVRKFIETFSTVQVAIYGRLSVTELQELKAAGAAYKEYLAENGTAADQKRIFVEEPLLGKVNAIHHQLWMATRDLAKTLDPTITIRDHAAHKAHNIMTPEEIAADNASVQGYGLILNEMPQEAFDYLIGKCAG